MRVFTSDTQANEAVRDGIASPACSPFRCGVHTAKTRCLKDQVTGFQEAFSLCFSFKHKADDGAVLLHLSNGNRMGRVLRKARIANTLHLWLRCEQPGNFQGVLALSFQTHVQRGERAMGQPDFHWTWDRSLLAAKGVQSFCPCRLSCCHMAE